jgi:Ca2+-binding EF-hand superfamily protein
MAKQNPQAPLTIPNKPPSLRKRSRLATLIKPSASSSEIDPLKIEQAIEAVREWYC